MAACKVTRTNRTTVRRACVVPGARARLAIMCARTGQPQQIAENPVRELHRLGVLEEVHENGVHRKEVGWNKRSVHERPAIVGKPGIETRNKPAEIDLDQNHDGYDRCRIR